MKCRRLPPLLIVVELKIFGQYSHIIFTIITQTFQSACRPTTSFILRLTTAVAKIISAPEKYQSM